MSRADQADQPAFPSTREIQRSEGLFTEQHFGECGLTKRELFAALVLSGLAGYDDTVTVVEQRVRSAVSHADALLSALRGEEEGGKA